MKLLVPSVRSRSENLPLWRVATISAEPSLQPPVLGGIRYSRLLPSAEDIRSTLSRCEKGKFQQPEEISPELEKRLSDFSQKPVAPMATPRESEDTLSSELETQTWESLGAHTQENVTLDPDTAHPQLILSENRKSVSWGNTRQQLPSNFQRFDSWGYVLCCEGFTSGRHCWEVEVGPGGYWAVGVARENVARGEKILRSPDDGIWAVELWGNQFWALTSHETPLPLSQVPKRIRVCLDCDQGQVTFIDAHNKAPIFTFPPGSIPGKRIQPWLRVGSGTQLRLWP
nr:butyrophilin subfamily 1 member A1-like [Chrysemys picta bellii]